MLAGREYGQHKEILIEETVNFLIAKAKVYLEATGTDNTVVDLESTLRSRISELNYPTLNEAEQKQAIKILTNSLYQEKSPEEIAEDVIDIIRFLRAHN